LPRLIDANKLIAKWKPVVKRYEGDSEYCWIGYILEEVIKDVENEPTIDAEPIRHGHIVYRERYRIKYGKYTGADENGEEHTITVCEDYGSGKEPYCSECGSQLAESSVNYCPRCGAKLSEINDMEKLIEALKTTKGETAKGLILENYMRNHKMDSHEYAEAIRMLTSDEVEE